MKIDFDQIRELLAVVSQTDITELTIESGEEKVTVKKAPATIVPHQIEIDSAGRVGQSGPTLVESRHQAVHQVAVEDTSSNNGLVPIASPMVGTFYRSPSPSAPSFIEVGDIVSVGQTVCIIEAMKLMNDLPSEISGKIMKVCVDNGTTVEYGQALFMVDPNG